MTQAKIYWDKEDYSQVEATFRKSVEFCSEHDVWKLNVAHVLFMQVRVLVNSSYCLKCNNIKPCDNYLLQYNYSCTVVEHLYICKVLLSTI